MKYFTKYLPVTGEVKEGDTFFFKNSTLPHIKNSLLEIKYPLSRDDDPKILVKLFLCSRDIQIGDKFDQLPGINGITYECKEKTEEFIIDNEGKSRTINSCFKIIGKISSGAKWVKEGDIFEETSLTASFYKFNDNKPLFNFRPMYYKSFENNETGYIVIRVKCSQCNTFH